MSSPKYTVRIDEEERYGDYRSVLRVERDGKVILEERDGGEPEDNTFGRDWGWVSGALEQAYALGLEDGATGLATEGEVKP